MRFTALQPATVNTTPIYYCSVIPQTYSTSLQLQTTHIIFILLPCLRLRHNTSSSHLDRRLHEEDSPTLRREDKSRSNRSKDLLINGYRYRSINTYLISSCNIRLHHSFLLCLCQLNKFMLSVHRATQTSLPMAMPFEEQPLHTVLTQMHGLELTMVWITD